MINKELLMMGGADSEATVVLRIQHTSGEQSTVTMAVQYEDPPYTGFQLLPSIPLYETVEYTIKVPKGTAIQVWGGTNDLQGIKATPNSAIEDYRDNQYLGGKFRVLDSCVIEGFVYTY